MYNADKLTSIDLGRQGENLARTVEIDVSGMLAQWPDATITLLVKRKHDAEPYIVDTMVKDGVLFWPITAVETADAGDGKLEIRATCGKVIAKSATGSFRVTASLTGSGTEPPVTEQGWVERVLAAGPVWNRTPLWRLKLRAERKQQLKTPVKARLRYRPLWKQQRRKCRSPDGSGGRGERQSVRFGRRVCCRGGQSQRRGCSDCSCRTGVRCRGLRPVS